ncbi:MAG: STAS domain-containing protein [Firmicutes bacterium]|nr:STAS domain-containing protein [Bacillota bacterium]
MQIEHCGQFVKIFLPKRIDLINVHKFKRSLQTLFEQGQDFIMVDCTALTMIDSAGLGSLVMFQKKLKDRGGKLKIVNVRHRYIRHLFDMIELSKIICIAETDT